VNEANLSGFFGTLNNKDTESSFASYRNITDSAEFRTEPNFVGNQMNSDCIDETPDFLYEELSADQDKRIRQNSPYGSLLTWKISRVIVKSGDDLRHEQFAMQLVSLIHQIFMQSKL
jgi:phosphatidylinositol 4-kinase B